MMNILGYDDIGLSTEEKPDAESMVKGAIYYEVDTGKFYIAYKGQWYEQTFDGSEE